ncbi:hypothetical protein K461DRAFT_323541 [Myriangium duriaei CBS 260.36]|uniref:BTB domain-containing protein n=1 Tax=Myriangium duriaei CBS 260.36 TaxID=1168546 RepID=A0A9P4MDK1_9PEZI|nr:hypothetical protein K461DRAFT_323541 [Myriangium duriaei CBS 260.36]
MEEPPASPGSTIADDDMTADTVLYHGGDVIIVSEEQPKIRFIVSSILLAHVSPVFQAMLCGNFIEGRSRSASEPRTLPLDDPVDSLEFLLRLVHHRMVIERGNIRPRHMVRLAIISDKYQCSDIITWHVREWFRTCSRTWNFHETCCMVVTAAISNVPDEFRRLTSSLIMDFPTELSEISEDEGLSPWIKTGAVNQMAKQRLAVKAELMQALRDHEATLLACGCGIQLDSALLSTAIKSILERCLSNTIESFKALGRQIPTCPQHGRQPRPECPGLDFDEVPTVRTGLCLSCYKSNSSKMWTCKGHEYPLIQQE